MKNEIVIHNKIKKQCANEHSFLMFLQELYPSSKHINKEYQLPNTIPPIPINTLQLIDNLERNEFLTPYKKEKVQLELKILPDMVLVVNETTNISVDFAIVHNNTSYFIEFHEKQHRIDSNKRCNKVYDLDGTPINVPRYLQRLFRDIWRWRVLNNYTIVWYDWFAANMRNNEPSYLNSCNMEFSLPNKFRISGLIDNET
ncbi:MAG: hypothetical protein HN528_13065 [Candidatus Marinimicrobia bacterium]|jgi:hypothetical protein|nr:hypothetical protein [Candidatus Neomarinimicrobiota bacterium]